MSRSHQVLAVGLVAIFCTLAAGASPEDQTAEAREVLNRAMELNRKGEWAEARELMAALLERFPTLPVELRCEAMSLQAYGSIRTRDRSAGTETIEAFDESCSGVAENHWMHGEIRKLHEELARPPLVAPNDGSAGILRRCDELFLKAQQVYDDGDFPAARVRLTEFEDLAIKFKIIGPAWTYFDSYRKIREDLERRLGRRPPYEPNRTALSQAGDGEDGFWRTTAPIAQGLDPVAIGAHERLCGRTGADACLVVHRGTIVSEWYGPHYERPLGAMSSTKSIASLLTGKLIDDGKIPGIDTPVGLFIPEWSQGPRAEVTLLHLLTHTSGLPETPAEGVTLDAKSLVPSRAPGNRFEYSNEGVLLLSPVLRAAAGMPLKDYARQRLFEPLGMRDTRLKVHPDELTWTHADMQTTPRDLARIGLMMLNEGRWKDEQIVDREWIRASITPKPPRPDHGLLWWLYFRPVGFGARGYLDTNLYVFPGLDLVVVRMQSQPRGFELGLYEPVARNLFQRMVPEPAQRRDAASPKGEANQSLRRR